MTKKDVQIKVFNIKIAHSRKGFSIAKQRSTAHGLDSTSLNCNKGSGDEMHKLK